MKDKTHKSGERGDRENGCMEVCFVVVRVMYTPVDCDDLGLWATFVVYTWVMRACMIAYAYMWRQKCTLYVRNSFCTFCAFLFLYRSYAVFSSE